MAHGQHHRRYRSTVVPFLLILLLAGSGWAGRPPSEEEEARVRREWEEVRENYERVLKGHERRLADIDAKEGGRAASREVRAEKITRERAAGTMAARTDGAKGGALAQKAPTTMPPATMSGEIDKAPAEYVERAIGEWREGGERTALREATTVLQKNATLISSYLAAVTEAVQAMSMRVRQSGVLDKAAQLEAAAREAGERLSARWERERAARERERTQREREAGERARGRP